MKIVVDTNVAIVANGINTNACETCELACVEFLYEITKNRHIVALDESELIMNEYCRYLSHHGQPGVGDLFFKYLYDHQYNSDSIVNVPITASGDSNGFSELPDNQLDRSDRKFLAVAVVTQSCIINAVDGDWAEQNKLLDSLKVNVVELCHQN